MGILKMPPFGRVRLLTRDEHAHSFCRCVESLSFPVPLDKGNEDSGNEIVGAAAT